MKPPDLRQTALIFAITVGIPLATATRDGPYAMYARMVRYHLEIHGTTAVGQRVPVNPNELVSRPRPSAALVLASSDHDRWVAQIDALRAHVDDLARLTCDVRGDLATSEVHLVEQRGEHDEPTVLESRTACVR